MFIGRCRTIDFGKIDDPRGHLTFLESGRQVPFNIQRIFYIYGVPPGQTRGCHAHQTLHQLIVCLCGSFDVVVDDGLETFRYRLSDPSQGLYVPPLIWDTESNFTAGSVCLVLASDYYVEEDYYRDYNAYLSAVAQARLEEQEAG
jgi:hypothetical protein